MTAFAFICHMSPLSILFVLSPDDAQRAALLSELAQASLRTHPARDVAALAALRRTYWPDMILCAPAQDDPDPCALIHAARQADAHTPLLVISADAAPETRRRLFEAGAHDVLIAPYKPPELLLRIMRLTAHADRHLHEIGDDWHFDLRTGTLCHRPSGAVCRMPSSEAWLLQRLLTARGRIVAHDELIHQISGIGESLAGLASLVARLRRRLATLPHITCAIVAVRNRGYRLVLHKPS